jgi:hypothetical protein
MSTTKRLCPIKGCSVAVPNRNTLMCATHWHMVPRSLRSEVWRWWRNGNLQMHAEAKAKAIAAVEKTEAEQAEAGVQQVML